MPDEVHKAGVIDYPIAEDMALTGIWDYIPNPDGPAITTKQGFLAISRGATYSEDQSTGLRIRHAVQVAGGAILRFDIKYEHIYPETEVKLTLTQDVILRYWDHKLNYVSWNNGSFRHLGRSTISIGSSKYTEVTLCFWSKGIAVFENGDLAALWNKNVAKQIKPMFNWKIWSGGSSLRAQIRSILVILPNFTPGKHTPWDIALSRTSVPPADIWEVSKRGGDPIPISYSSDGYMRAAVAVPMAPTGLVTHRVRVNVSGSSESKITFLGHNILRITDDGRTVRWNKWQDGHFDHLSDSSIAVDRKWNLVTLIYSHRSVSVLENGIYKFTRNDDGGYSNDAKFSVQHWDAGTAVSVDISHVRCVPLLKTAEMLIRDLQPSVLAYYPLKTDVSDAITSNPALDMVSIHRDGFDGFVHASICVEKPTLASDDGSISPNDHDPIKGAFGNAYDFSTISGALKLPLFPYGNLFQSYTLSLWVKIDSYPPTTSRICGPLSIRSDGRIIYHSKTVSGKPEGTTYSSRRAAPKRKWMSIIVTYAYEKSCFALFIDGELDTVDYLSSDSQCAIVSMDGFVGGSEYPNKALDGQISDIMFFKQHVHDLVALALANRLDDGNYKKKKAIYSLIPAFLAIAYGAISTPAIVSALEVLTENPLPSLQSVVDVISKLVGKPARPGVQVSREDICINEDYPVVIDVGGEGPLDRYGLAAGFKSAINVNAKEYIELGSQTYIPIPNLVLVQPQGSGPDSYPTLPFADNFADIVTMVGRPLDLPTANEIVRIIKSTGTINIWTDESFLPVLEDMAKKLKSYVCSPSGLDRFVAGGKAFPKRWQVVANKDGKHSM